MWGEGDLLGSASCPWVGKKQAKLRPESCLLATLSAPGTGALAEL